MTFREYKYLILSDLFRYAGKTGRGVFLKHFLLGEGFRFTFWMRTCHYASLNSVLRRTIYFLIRVIFRRSRLKYGISISHRTKIGPGFFIGHIGGIVINENSVIGRNCNIGNEVTIGKITMGSRKGTPQLGDNVYIGAGAKIIGGIKIGDNVAIGANCVVTKNIPDNGVVVGVPGVVRSLKGSYDYINRTEYDQCLTK